MGDIVFAETAGWIGAGLVVLAYFLVSHDRLKSTSHAYHAMNLIGALGVGVNAFAHQTWPSLVVQVLWVFIAVSALVKNKIVNARRR